MAVNIMTGEVINTLAGTQGLNLIPGSLTVEGAVDVGSLTINGVPVTSGNVSSVSVTTANGVSGIVATPTTTPAITLTLGAITPSSVAATGSISTTGDLDFLGAARRLTGVMTPAVQNDNFAIQSNALNQRTRLDVIPNGTSVLAGVRCFDNSDRTNASMVYIGASNLAGFNFIGSDITGAGTMRGLLLGVGSLVRLVINTNGVLGVGAFDTTTTSTEGYPYISACAGTPTGVPLANTGRVPITIDSTANRQYFHNGSSWQNTNTPDYDIITATNLQTVFNTTNVRTVANAGGKAFLQVFVDGVKQIEGGGDAYTVTGTTQVTFNVGVVLNQKVEFYGFS